VIDGRAGGPAPGREARKSDYYLKITAYATICCGALGEMQGWPERVRAMQANWLGKSQGVRSDFRTTREVKA